MGGGGGVTGWPQLPAPCSSLKQARAFWGDLESRMHIGQWCKRVQKACVAFKSLRKRHGVANGKKAPAKAEARASAAGPPTSQAV